MEPSSRRPAAPAHHKQSAGCADYCDSVRARGQARGGMTRREWLRGAAALGPAIYLAHNTVLRTAFGAPETGSRNVVFVELMGGNDGINTIVPYGLNSGAYYNLYRPTICIPENKVLKIANNTELGFNDACPALKAHFDAGRLAVVQGVSYPKPSFSHATAARIWAWGDPTLSAPKSWLSNYLDSTAIPHAPPVAAELLDHMTDIYGSSESFVPAFDAIEKVAFPFDAKYPGDKHNRRQAYEQILTSLSSGGGPNGAMAETGMGVLDLIDSLHSVEMVPDGNYPPGGFSHALRLALSLMKANVGMRIFHVAYPGFDTHSAQDEGDFHRKLLVALDGGLAAFQQDLSASGLAARTIVVVYSEFGRAPYENGSAGTDHGSVTPVFILGLPVIGGFVTPHPSIDPGNLTPFQQFPMVVDFRDVLGTVAVKWMGSSPTSAFSNFTVQPLPFLV